MPRASYTPPTRDIERKIAKVVNLREEIDRKEEEYKRLLTALVDKDGDNVPVAYMADRLGVERKTVYRHTGRPMQ